MRSGHRHERFAAHFEAAPEFVGQVRRIGRFGTPDAAEAAGKVLDVAVAAR